MRCDRLRLSVSGVTPEEPVVSKKSGHVYEKRLILQHLLASGGKDPETGEDMNEEDLINVKLSGSSVKPTPTTNASIPGTLTQLRNEWDSVMLESFKLKQTLKSTRLELSHSLYYYDASLRVIARLTDERDEARKALMELRNKGVYMQDGNENKMNGSSNVNEVDPMEVEKPDAGEPQALSEEVIENIGKKAEALKKWRMKRPAISGLLKPRASSSLVEKDSRKYHVEGVSVEVMRTAMKVENPLHGYVFVGCSDGSCKILNEQATEIQSQFKAHEGGVTALSLSSAADVVISTGADQKSCVARHGDGGFSQKASFKYHSQDITGCSIHPTDDYFATCSKDGKWAIHDIETVTTLASVVDPDGSPNLCAEFHPDGAIFASGLENGIVRVWDVRSLTSVASFETESGPVSTLTLSENGYSLVSVAGKRKAQLWDLRKLKSTKGVEFDEDMSIQNASFDASGTFVAFCGSRGLKVYEAKKWREQVSLSSEELTCIGWNRTATTLYSGDTQGSVVSRDLG
uniref:Pre-mRNA-processing factor 19 n=1 Tax=Rhodosorus marinus TaxID=101924 RepID=A0A7S3A6H4_9RHOD|mmetsp:Transcript_4549/g.19511  ORF Transcript_4549/g.19511 Transcript_4549/m.19511 type:complete len:517 (+) Transcript_4549:332-1882(+)